MEFYFNPSELRSPESSSASDTAGRINVSNEEVMLASCNPKKRAGRIKFRETRHPIYRGVRRRNSDKWVCEVREPKNKSRIWLGTYETAEMAARAHDVAAIALRGRSTCLNFADSTWRLPIPASSDVKDIQRAAAVAAEMFGPYNQSDDVANVNNLIVEEKEETFFSLPENAFYNDDEAVFGTPEFFADMAEGLMLPPPPQCGGGGDHYYGADDMEISADVSLWSYSM